MLDLLFTVAFGSGLCLLCWGMFAAFDQIATHMRGNPEAVKAIVEHVFMPLFGGKKEPDLKSAPGPSQVLGKPSVEPLAKDHPANPD